MPDKKPEAEVIDTSETKKPEEKTQNEMTLDEMEKNMQRQKKKREMITEFIDENMVEGKDYDRIHFSSSCKYGENCNNDAHFSKETLMKPGAEKFTSLFSLRPAFEMDRETWEMSGKKEGLFCYKCELLDDQNRVTAEGRGACDTENKRNENVAIKIAQKRAKVDAVLSHGGLSDFFTQDLDDMNTSSQNKAQQSNKQNQSNTNNQKQGYNQHKSKQRRKKEQIFKLVTKICENSEHSKPEKKDEWISTIEILTGGIEVEPDNYDRILDKLMIIIEKMNENKKDDENESKKENDVTEKYPCSQCDKSFGSEIKRKMHRSKDHKNEKKKQDKDEQKEDETETKEADENQENEGIQDMDYETLDEFIENMCENKEKVAEMAIQENHNLTEKHRDKLRDDYIDDSDNTTESDEKTTDDGKLDCPECDKTYDSERGLQTHFGMKHEDDVELVVEGNATKTIDARADEDKPF